MKFPQVVESPNFPRTDRSDLSAVEKCYPDPILVGVDKTGTPIGYGPTLFAHHAFIAEILATEQLRR